MGLSGGDDVDGNKIMEKRPAPALLVVDGNYFALVWCDVSAFLVRTIAYIFSVQTTMLSLPRTFH